MSKTIHPSMMATMQDDIAEYNDAVTMAGRLDSTHGWSAGSLRFEGMFHSPSGKPIDITEALADELSPTEMTTILGMLVAAQERIVARLQKNIQDEYGISIG